MKIFSAVQIQAADAYTIQNEPIASEDLMERAGSRLTDKLLSVLPSTQSYAIFAGPGNNGGDGLVMARLLKQKAKQVVIYILEAKEYSADFKFNLERLSKLPIELVYIKNSDSIKNISIDEKVVIIDALFGNGLNRPLDGLAAELVSAINSFTQIKLAIDIPSGLSADSKHESTPHNTITADFTFTLQLPKLSFFFPENKIFIGNWEVIDIGLSNEFVEKEDTHLFCLDSTMISDMIKPRSFTGHKGTFGHALIVAGSSGKIGASILASHAALRAGCGLLTLQAPSSGATAIHAHLPEAMVIADENPYNISTSVKDVNMYDAIGFGPGIGRNKETAQVLKLLIQDAAQPLVVDADGLNIIAENLTWLQFLNGHTIFTPHPGEFDRLTQKHSSGHERFKSQLEFSRKHGVYIVLKGAHTSITTPGGLAFFNTTGNNGMATAGSGDVLTGIITSLSAQGYSPLHACLLGVYLHGYAGDCAAANESKTSMIATDIINHIPDFFLEFEK